MARRPAPPSSFPDAATPAPTGEDSRRRRMASTPRRRDRDRNGAGASARRRVDVREWLGGIRLSGFMVVMLGLVVLAVFVLVPTLGVYLDQRARIAALEESVALTADEVATLEAQQQRWADPAYITTQARERLYYVKPGEVVYLVDDDLDPALLPQAQQEVSDEVVETRNEWMSQLVRSVTGAGIAQTATDPLVIGVPDAPEDAPEDGTP